MNLLIDFCAIKSGGGAQLATNFIDRLEKIDGVDRLIILIPNSGPLANLTYENRDFLVIEYPTNYFRRMLFDRFKIFNIYKKFSIDKVFTFFGSGLPHPSSVKSIVTVAYPVICYPDSPYWKYIDSFSSIKKRIVNALRRHRLRRADLIITETKIMKIRIARSVGINENRIIVMPPTPTQYLKNIPYEKRKKEIKNCFLVLSGTDPHKNIWRLPDLAKALKNLGLNNFKFIITATEESLLGSIKVDKDTWALVRDHFSLIGQVEPRKIGVLYEQANFLLSLSDLESFSNNYMEAWKAGLPIIASNRDFANAICGDSAIYVEPHNVVSAAKVIYKFIIDYHMHENMVKVGKKHLQNLGTAEDRFSMLKELLIN